MYDGFCFCSNSTKLIATKVSAAVKNSFARRYPGIITMWEKEDGKYEASFKKDGDSMSALFEQMVL